MVIKIPDKKEFIPTDLVGKLAAQGKSEPEIIQQLRAQGFTPSQIDKALKIALKQAVEKPQSLLRPKTGTSPEEIPKGFKPTRRPLMEIKEQAMQSRPAHPEKSSIPPGLHLAEIPAPEEKPLVKTEKSIERPAEKEETKTKEKPIGTMKPKRPEVHVSSRPAHPTYSAPPTAPATGAVRPPEIRHEITLEELVEQIVGEHEKKVEVRMNEFERVDKDTQQRLSRMEDSVNKFQSTLDAHIKDSRTRIDKMEDIIDSFAARFEALETAFKQFADLMKKK